MKMGGKESLMIRSRLVLAHGALAQVAAEFAKEFPGKKPLVFADANTWRVAGEAVWKEFGRCEKHLYDDKVYADDGYVDETASVLRDHPDHIAVAVGSGTINDLSKRASFLNERPYMCVATAPSVDGFTSNGAAITDHGLKVTLPCPAPVLVVADPDMLAAAPMDMIAAGYGDLAAKVPAGADWIVTDTLGIEPIDGHVWNLVQPKLKWQLEEPKKLACRDSEVIARVFDGLIHTGFAMQEYFDSRPASGADHLFSHVWEMNHIGFWKGKAASHGFKVAIGTLSSTAIYTELLKLSRDDLEKVIARAPHPVFSEREQEVRKVVTLSKSVADRQVEICAQKWLEGKELDKRREDLLAHWDALKAKVSGQLIPFDDLKARFALASCPTEPADLEISRTQWQYGMRAAQMMRKRYTVLDVVYELGLMDEMVETISNPEGSYFHAFA